MTQSIVSSKKAINFFALFPIIMTILSPYSLTDGGGVYICDVLLVLMSLYLLTAKSIIFYKPLFALLAIDCLLTLLAFLFTESSNTNLLLAAKVAVVFTLYLFVYSKIWSCDIKESFLRIAEIIGIICAVLAILQFIFASIGFNFYDGKLFLPLGEGSHFGGLFDRNTKDLRVHSFFEEPSYLAFFELPIIAHLVQEKKYVKTIICAISCVISGSMIGVLGLIIVLCSMLLLDSKFEKKYKIRLLILMIVAVLGLIYVYNSNLSFKALIDYYIQRSMSIESSSTRSDSSFSQRIMGNSELFGKYSIINKFVGVGFNQYSLYFEIFKDYSNDFVSNLLNFGYIGIISMIAVLLIIFRRSTGHGRVFALIFILLLSVDHAWFGTMFFYILTWVIMKSGTQQTTMNLRMRI